MLGDAHWILERRVSAVDAGEAMPLVCQGNVALKKSERCGAFVI